MPNDDLIAGRTLEEWQELARRDDVFDIIVPSDLRCLVKEAIELRDEVEELDEKITGLYEDLAGEDI